MKYMLLMNYRVEGVQPMSTWAPEDIKAHIDFQIALNERPTEAAAVDTQALEGTERARIVTFDGRSAPVARRPVPGVEGVPGRLPDGRRRESGARPRDRRGGVPAPGPGGVPIQQEIEVRALLAAFDVDE